MGVLDRGGNRRMRSSSFGDEFWAISGDFVASLCESDALFPNYFGEDLFTFKTEFQKNRQAA